MFLLFSFQKYGGVRCLTFTFERSILFFEITHKSTSFRFCLKVNDKLFLYHMTGKRSNKFNCALLRFIHEGPYHRRFLVFFVGEMGDWNGVRLMELVKT